MAGKEISYLSLAINLNDDSIGVHNKPQLRVGLSYVIADETLPPAE